MKTTKKYAIKNFINIWKNQMPISPDLEQYYEKQFEMMATDGWKEFELHFQEMLASTNSLDGAESEKDLFIRKGELNIIRLVLNWKEMVETAYEQNKEEPTFFDKVRDSFGL